MTKYYPLLSMLFALVILPTFSIAQTNLIFFSQDGDPFFVVLDGVKFNETPQTNVKIPGVPAGQHAAKILFENKTMGTIDKNVYTEDFKEVTYAIKQKKNGTYTLRVNNIVDLPMTAPTASTPPPTYQQPQTTPPPTGGTISHSTTTTTTNNGAPPTGENINIGINVNDEGASFGFNVNASGTSVNSSTTTTTTTYTETTGSVPPPPPAPAPTNTRCSFGMSPTDFNAALISIKGKTFEDSKLTMAKQITNSNCLSADQITQVMQTFDFEDTKLDYAKFAYPLSFDPQNYFKVNNAFEFESSIEELDNFISRNR